MARLTNDLISIYRAEIEPWKIDHDEAMRDWDEFEGLVSHGTSLLAAVIRSFGLYNQQVANGRIRFDPEIEEDHLKAISELLEASADVFLVSQEYAERGYQVEGVPEMRAQCETARAILEQYSDSCSSDESGHAQNISPDYSEIRDMMTSGVKPEIWYDYEES